MANKKKLKKMAAKYSGKWSHTHEKVDGSTRHGVYHQEKGDMKVMGIGRKGHQRASKFAKEH